MMRILIICSANSCRSQMAEAFLRHLDSSLMIESAGTDPAVSVHPLTIKAMDEIGFDISTATTQHINQLVPQDWDFVLTVCDLARESCPAFTGNVKNFIFLKFEDPLAYKGDDDFLLKLIRSTRTHIRAEMEDFYNEFITSK